MKDSKPSSIPSLLPQSSDIRQRRPPAQSTSSQPYASSSTTIPPSPTSIFSQEQSLPRNPPLNRWRHIRSEAPLPIRILMHLAELFFLALTIRILAQMHHSLVKSVDETWEMLSRRAQSPFSPPSLWNVGMGLFMIAMWHFVLGGIGFRSAAGLAEAGDWADDGRPGIERKKKATWGWGRVLGSVIVPIYLVSSLGFHVYAIFGRLKMPLIIDIAAAGDRPEGVQ